jgi:hypothetical protein
VRLITVSPPRPTTSRCASCRCRCGRKLRSTSARLSLSTLRTTSLPCCQMNSVSEQRIRFCFARTHTLAHTHSLTHTCKHIKHTLTLTLTLTLTHTHTHTHIKHTYVHCTHPLDRRSRYLLPALGTLYSKLTVLQLQDNKLLRLPSSFSQLVHLTGR